MTTKVSNTVSLNTSQGDVIVTKGKLIILPKTENDENPWNNYNIDKRCLIISETEEIQEGDIICRAFDYAILRDNVNSDNRRGEKFYKVLALPENFSPKHLQAIVDDKFKDGDEVYVECQKGYITPGGMLDRNSIIIKPDSQNHIILHKVEQKTYTREKVEYLLQQYRIFGPKDSSLPEHNKWLKENLK